VKALVTGGAGFIGSHLSERLLDQGAEVTAIDCFTDYYPRPLKEANIAALRRRPGYRLVETSIADADLPALLDGVTHVFHLAQAGVRKAGAASSRSRRSTWTRRKSSSRPAWDAPSSACLCLELVGLRRQRGAAHARGGPPAPGVAVRRDEACRRAAVLPVFRQSRRAHRVAALLHGLRASAAPGHGLQPVLHGHSRQSPPHAVRRRLADA
jgi:hypothetical protein